MPGSDTTHANGDGSLLRQATQAMMSKPNEDDGHDHIDSDTPQSGVATPIPDLSDKRLPGITHSYFGQVGTGSSTTPTSVPLETPAIGSDFVNPLPRQRETTTDDVRSSETQSLSHDESDSAYDDEDDEAPPLLPHERAEASKPSAQPMSSGLHPYPTPPISTAPSLHKLKMSDSGSEGEGHDGDERAHSDSSSHHDHLSESFPTTARRSSMLNPLSNILTPQTVHAAHFSNPSEPYTATSPSPSSPAHSRVASGHTADSPSYDRLKKLTDDAGKSQPGTPTRALSNSNQSQNEKKSEVGDVPIEKLEEEKIASSEKATDIEIGDEASGGSNGATVVAPRGKLTVKIVEARGLRKARDPYVVATFQRNELVSKGPRDEEVEEEDEAEAKNPTGGIPILRTASESGRAMAIPMKSRQSSGSDGDYRDVRTHAVKALSNPKWDTEAAFDVVGAENRVNLSIYDRGSEREDFLGNVDFQPHLVENDPSAIKGWFELKGRNSREAISGEIYVEITYQRTDKRHFGPEDFDILKLIGKGTFGQVYQVRKKDTKRIYAMKVLQKKVIVQKKEVAHTVGERNILVRTAMADSPFIVGLKFSFQTPSDLYLVTDYMSGGELFWHLQKEGRFNEARAKFYIAELILALQHLHMHDIVYRDLKPENILLDANGHIALCDFGLSKANLTKNDTTNTFCGTTEYLAPEVLLDEAGYTKMVDFWSLGVLVFEMCCGWSPFYAEDTQQMYKNIAFGKVRFPRETLTTEGRNFVKGLLNRNPKHRLGATDDAEELKRHPFFADIDWEALTKKLIAPPFKPKLKSETDTSNFDPEFTNALNGASSLNARAAALAAGISSSTPLSPGMQANFKGFTFVDENLMEENLRHRIKDDYDDMDEDLKDDTHWEQAAANSRRDDRMSGVVNNGGFDM